MLQSAQQLVGSYAMGRILFACNMKTQGKIHKVTADTAQLPRGRQRVRCGWNISSSTSVVFNCSRLKWGIFCRKCFPKNGANEGGERKNDEDIEEFEDE